jgi:hypothetical protein
MGTRAPLVAGSMSGKGQGKVEGTVYGECRVGGTGEERRACGKEGVQPFPSVRPHIVRETVVAEDSEGRRQEGSETASPPMRRDTGGP